MSGLSRKIAFAMLSTTLMLAGLELTAIGVERIWPLAPLRPLPKPGDAGCLPDCMPGVASMPEQPEGLPRGIPMAPHGRRAWALAPNTTMVETNVAVRVNSLALRGPEIGPKLTNERRILTLGDSSVFGFGVDEESVFSSVAARQLASAWELTVTPVIGATPGYTSVQSLHTLQDVGAIVQPDVVVIATLWSDLFQTETPIERLGGQQHPLAIYRVAVRLLAPWLAAPTVGWVQGEVGSEKLGRSARVGLDRFANTLQELVRASMKLNAQPVVMILPAPIDLDVQPTPPLIAAYRDALKNVANQHGLVLVDGPEYFLKNRASNTEFFDQVHPSKSGHQWLGDALAEAITTQRKED